jgi:riboflavin synthase
MFTGIIEGLGTIKAVKPSGQGKRLIIQSDFVLEGSKVGDSICVNGACLTAVVLQAKLFEVDVSPETVSKSTFANVTVGERVNLERAMHLSDRIDGHLVSGHLDGIGRIAKKELISNAIVVAIDCSSALTRYMIKKGSVAVDGISLTINSCDQTGFSVSIVPYTAKLTTIGFKETGAPVNIETDMIGKYVERFLKGEVDRPGDDAHQETGLSMDFLTKTGFV